MSVLGLAPELSSLGVALGLLDENQELRPQWFSDPLASLKRVLVDPVQRAALLDVVEGVLPSDEDGPDAAGETWHPLLHDPTSPAQLFVTLLRGAAGQAELGVAGRVHCSTTGVAADITIKAALVHADGETLSPVVGTAGSPMRARVAVLFSQNDLGFDSIGLDALIAPLAAPGPTADLRVEVGVLDAAGNVQPTLVDPAHLDAIALQLVAALLQQRLDVLAAQASVPAPLAALAHHLLPVMGLDQGLPRLAVERFGEDPNVLQEWLDRLRTTALPDGQPAVTRWLEHLAGLLGAPSPTGAGTPADPWAVRVATVGTGGLDLTFCFRTVAGGPQLLVGVQLNLDSADVRAQLAATLLAMPLTGSAAASRVLPDAMATLRCPRDATTDLVNAPGEQFTIGALHAGVNWDGAALRPLIELTGVELAGTSYPVVDLSNVGSAQAAVASVARDAMRSALGDTGPGRHLAALAGLLPPVSDPGSPLADPVRLVTEPTRELGRLHRNLLTDPSRGWRHMLAAVGGVLGLGGVPSGSGTTGDPWRLEIASSDPWTLELAGWTAAPVAADAVPLRLGLRASASAAALSGSWLAELLAVDLPASGPASLELMAGQHARLALSGPFALDAVAGLSVGFHDADARLDWRPGGPLVPVVHLNGLELGDGDVTVRLPALALPPAGFDVTLPDLGLAVTVPDLLAAVRILLSRLAVSTGGRPGFVLAGLLGLHGRLPGLPVDWPLLSLPGGAGLDELLTSPLEALRLWLGRILLEVSADGTPFALPALAWLRALLRGAIPDVEGHGAGGGLDLEFPELDLEIGGSGTYENPWRLGLSDTGHTQLLGWLEPDGPPASWAESIGRLAAAAADGNDLADLAARLQPFAAELRGPFGASPGGASGPSGPGGPLETLDAEFGAGDGVVPLAAQLPDAPGWTIGAEIVDAAHHLLPSHPTAIAQVLAQLDAWQPEAERAAVFLGPPFADSSAWSALLAAAGGAVPGAHFDLRSAPDPAVAPLGAVTAVAPHYTADLVDSGGDLSEVTAQIDGVVRRVSALRDGRPVILVAHSTAGVAARAFAAANPSSVRGLITLGTPHGPAPLTALTTAEGGEVVRALQRLLAVGTIGGSLADALGHLTNVLDGWAPGSAADRPAVRLSYPLSRFAGSDDPTTGGVPALALGGQLTDTLLTTAAAAVEAVAGGTRGSRNAPTHLAIGVRAELTVPAAPSTGDVAVDAGVRLDAFRVQLSRNAAEPARAARRLAVEIALTHSSGWLLATDATRVRRAEFGLTMEAAPQGTIATPHLRLYDAAVSAPAVPLVDLANPMAEPLIDAIMSVLASPGSPGAALADALEALGLVVRDGTGRPGVSAEALGALRTDAGSFLASRIRGALQRPGGLLGLVGPAGGPWRLAVPGLPLKIEIRPDPWRVGMSTGPAGADLGHGIGVDASVELTVHGLQAAASARLTHGGAALSCSSAPGRLALVPWAGATEIPLAPAPPDLAGRLVGPLLGALASSIATAGLEHVLGPGWSVGSVAAMVRDPRGWLVSPSALGDGTQLTGERVAALLHALSVAAGTGADGAGLTLPGGFVVTAAGTPVTLTLETSPPYVISSPGGDGSLDVRLSATIGGDGHLTSGGRLVVDVPLSATWGGVAVTLGLDAGVVSLQVAPRAPGGPQLAAITLLPRFEGLGPLAGSAAEAVLPAVLDVVVAHLLVPRTAVADAALAVAEALGLYSGADAGFAAHGDQLRALAQPDALAHLSATQLAGAIAALWTVAGLPGQVTPDGSSAVRWAGTLAGASAGARLGWAGTPRIAVEVGGLTVGPVKIDRLAGGLADAAPSAQLDVSVALPDEAEQVLGLRFAPQLTLDVGPGGVTAALVPLGAGTAGALELTLLPHPGIALGAGGAAALVEQWALPLAVNAVIGQLRLADLHVFRDGPTLQELLRDVGLLHDSHLSVPLPPLTDVLLHAIARLSASSTARLRVTDTLHLIFAGEPSGPSTVVGVGLQGTVDIPAGAFDVSIRFGETAEPGIGDSGSALKLLLVETPGFAVHPILSFAPLGVRVSGPDGRPLLDTPNVHVAALAGYCWAAFDLRTGVHVLDLGAAVAVDDLGLPLSGASGGENPVAASMLGSDHDTDGGTDGDEQKLLPALGLVAVSRPSHDLALLRTKDGDVVPFDQNPLWIGVHRSFGPLSIDQVGFAYVSPPSAVELLVDGEVRAGGLTIQVDELAVVAPLKSLGSPQSWRLDLKGLAVGLQAGPVSLAGGLVKQAKQPVDYAGIVNVQVAGKGFSAVGAYSRPDDAQGPYTSLFVFVSLPIVIGGPPYLFVTGLGGGAGYNRRLLPPAAVTEVESFPLVSAINGGLADDPMAALLQMGSSMPPRRGSFWLAAGVKFTSFALVETTAVAYLALDRGVEIGVLGLSRAALPKPENALVRVELAIKARFSTEDGVLSVQAQLTDNSWLLSPDCQLTGGFAFFIWFRRSQFVLTLGGYHPAFNRPPDFPVVPRLGFHWAVSDSVSIKGESYFALTSSCVMAGGRLEAAYSSGGIQASFTVYADFLISWDPFSYDISAGVSVSVGFHKRVCFIACVTIDFHFSLDASVHILGPPLHGEATLDIEVCTVTVEFGARPQSPPTFLTWAQFAAKYVVAGAADGSAVSAHAGKGLLGPASGQGSTHPGTVGEPWRFGGDFVLSTETRMPATAYEVSGVDVQPPLTEVDATLALAPMNVDRITAKHTVGLTSLDGKDIVSSVERLVVVPTVAKVPAAVWRLVDHPVAAATLRTACSGLTITGTSQVLTDLQWPGGVPPVIPISELIDESLAAPLGLASVTSPVPAAHPLVQLVAAASGPALVEAAAAVLGPAGAKARQRVGLPAPSLLSVRALRYRRSSPPLLATLDEGLGRPPVPPGSRGAPRQRTTGVPSDTGSTEATPLDRRPEVPRWLAALRGPLPGVPVPAAPAPATSAPESAGALPRRTPPAPPQVPLRRMGTPGSAAPATRGPRLQNLALRSIVPVRGGAEVRAGGVQLWQVDGLAGSFVLSGPAAARAVFLDAAGTPVSDLEAVPGDAWRLTVPAGAAKLAVSCLGLIPPGVDVEAAPGAIALAVRAPERPAAAGWQDGALLTRVAPAALLGRGSSLRLGAPLPARAGVHALVPATAALAGQTACETTLPVAVDVVLVILDARGPQTPGVGPRVLADGARLAAPRVVAGGRRLHLFYDLVERDPERSTLTVAVGSELWQVAGVLGLRGRATEWASSIAESGPRQLVTHLPTTAAGSVTVDYERRAEDA